METCSIKFKRLTRKDKIDPKILKNFKIDGLLIKFSDLHTLEVKCAILVSKKVFKKAIERNKLKRRIREIARLECKKFKKGAILIFVALPGIKNDFYFLKETIQRLFQKANLY
ncbi:ribonuclease P protein component [Candidatus Parcubacteria bacterium]|nr:ribonuclease P protein component [Candidatus Parcubacteria bacterium]